MTIRHTLTLFACLALSACGSQAYDWAPTEATLARALPAGTSVDSAVALLEAMHFDHGTLAAGDSIPRARKRELDTNKLVFGTLQLVLTFDAQRHLISQGAYVVFTGP
jgi:hypothetical protein